MTKTLCISWVRITMTELAQACPNLSIRQHGDLSEITEWTMTDSGEDYALADAKQAVLEGVDWIVSKIEEERQRLAMGTTNPISKAMHALALVREPEKRKAIAGDFMKGLRLYTKLGETIWLEREGGDGTWAGRVNGELVTVLASDAQHYLVETAVDSYTERGA
ncbi:MAG: hypothetical protein ACRCUF_02980 [Aeromonas sobria]